MKTLSVILLTLVSVLVAPLAVSEIKKGDKLQTIVNLHPDLERRVIYPTNYQLPALLPVCSDITIKKVKKKYIAFEWKGVEYVYKWDKHTRKAGVSLQQAAGDVFGPSCDKKKIDNMSKADQKGIETGKPAVGMTREGIHIAMGRPPYHANPSLEAASYMYWINRFNRLAVEFDSKGKVKKVVN